MRHFHHSFLSNQQGMSAIEFSILLPVAALIVMGIIEFGITGMKGQELRRSLAAASGSVQADPLNQENFNLANSETALVRFDGEGTFICAQSYATLQEAQDGDCSGGWNTLPPEQDLTSYFVLLKGQVANAAITGLMDPFIGNISDKQVIGVNTAGGGTSGGDLMCNGDPLNNRMCASVVEHSSILRSRGDCNIYAGPYRNPFHPTCGPNGWTCQFAQFNGSARLGDQGDPASYPENPLVDRGQIGVTIPNACPLPASSQH